MQPIDLEKVIINYLLVEQYRCMRLKLGGELYCCVLVHTGCFLCGAILSIAKMSSAPKPHSFLLWKPIPVFPDIGTGGKMCSVSMFMFVIFIFV